ncbi:putative diguanylate cyclase (GGDEF domain) [Crocosphaera subtropica ATCC 51142]|uniref:Diguanylate cyclase (GGDEF domain) n=1 Tax=Crocosphaera subtropica (strain ATCC 51142 / BH68) TaxID=43989 RepID=B1WZW1_CROS5|nr:GGDEF domain-containing protein [Crocosphaera subtropica]ACB52860.1 putative diguanylate cyclase (GGDEF domain) [Crocosphaera subtropica ATCC 51142]
MLNGTSLQELIDNSEIQSLLSDLIQLIETPVSIEDINGNLVLGKSLTTSTEEYLIMADQQAIGSVKGDSSAQIIARLLSYLANQEKLVLFDDLTTIPNRRYFNRYYQQEWRRCQRENYPMSLLLCDLDYFKSYNDYYGHQQGDNCLRQVAQILQNTLKRPGDMVFRYGGEEFVIILPNTASEGAEIIAEQIVQSIQQEQIAHYPSPVSSYVTISLGIAVTFPTNALSPQTLFEMVDMALYRAKATGRNRYCLQTISEEN